ncbi:chorismate-pyruvate lyase [Klebsiella pneumoniae]|uniref:Chorismate-pyruvate lyase n=1 Tax=Klebsiella pneumoniae TaxID=573 RepID=A0A377WBJ1_KLEPN|nr:chorismate-pyruvate lyase [Klebsiella pneumoniae]
MSHPALTRLRALRYFAVMPSLPPPLSDWLLLEDSMTQRFEQQGKQVTVTLVNEGYIGRDALTDEAALLPDEPRYWLREIILNADGEPWLAGRTWRRSRRCVVRSWRYSSSGKLRWADTCLRRRH